MRPLLAFTVLFALAGSGFTLPAASSQIPRIDPASPPHAPVDTLGDICPPQPAVLGQRPKPHVRKVAIVGAGPTGSSASYFLKTAQDKLSALSGNATSDDAIKVTIFERDSRIGGRTAVVHPYDDEKYEPVELGASIYANINYNLRRAVQQFGLDTGAQNDVSTEMGIWDGQQFLLRGDASSWWTSAKLFLRYGNAPLTTQRLLKKALSSFLHLYSPKFLHSPGSSANTTASGFPWPNVINIADKVSAASPAAVTGETYFTEHGVAKLFSEEMIEAFTRVNYAQNMDQIHGFGALISLAASGATGLKDGNFRIFEEFVKRSGAELKQGEEGTVTGLVKFDSLRDAVKAGKISCKDALASGWTRGAADEARWWVGTRDGEGALFDAVIVATPWQHADITLLNTDKRIAKPPYVHLYVTLLTTTAASPRPEYFGFGKGDSVPLTILTSAVSVRRASALNNGTKAHGDLKSPNLEFNSLNYLRPLRLRSGEDTARSGESIVKLFSLAPLTDTQLHRLFDAESIGWVHRKEWYSYPMLSPTTRFPRVVVDENLYFPNAFESLVSTMETSTVSARNTVGLLLRRWYGDDFVNGGKGCPTRAADPNNVFDASSDDEVDDEIMRNDEWAGWGCRSG